MARPSTPADLVDHLCLSHTVWTARNEWIPPGVTGEVRWKRDAILRCNDGHGLRMAAVAGAGLLFATGGAAGARAGYRETDSILESLRRSRGRFIYQATRFASAAQADAVFVEHVLSAVQELR